MVSINIKSSSEKAVAVDVELSQTVAELKALISEKLPEYAKEQQLLIYSGRVLKDEETLTHYKVTEGNTIHVVKSMPRKPNTQPSNSTSATTPTNASSTAGAPSQPSFNSSQPAPPLSVPQMSPFAPFMGFPGMNPASMGPAPGMGPAPRMGATPGMGAPAMPNFDPASFLSLMNNPAVSQMMSQMLQNPQIMEAMMQASPMMQGVTPEMRQSMMQAMSTPNTMFNPASMMPQAAPTANMPSQPPAEERFASQLQQLTEMGFYSPTANLRALQLTGGNVNAAIEWLLNNPQ